MATKSLHSILISLMLGGLSLVGFAKQPALTDLRDQDLSNILGWINDPESNTLCRGYYTKPRPTDMNLTNSFDTDQHVSSDKAILSADETITRVNQILLQQNVRFWEPGLFLIGKQASLNFNHHSFELEDLLYRMKRPSPYGEITIRGSAVSVRKTEAGILKLEDAMYTSCPPTENIWELRGHHIELDRNSGWGGVSHSALYIKGFPVFYWPYFKFPIDSRRHTGLLLPTVAHSTQNGADVSLPVYWNIAPNYDMTITPRWLSERGIQLNSELRYLTPSQSGAIKLSWLPNDHKYAEFRRSAIQTFGNTLTTQPYLDEINQGDDTRGYLSLSHNATMAKHWANAVTLNYVTDPYFFQDMGTNEHADRPDQLLNQVDVTYSGAAWHFLGRLQAYQTLHQINQDEISGPYRRLPHLELGRKFVVPYGFEIQWDSELTRFDRGESFESGEPMVQGTRLFMGPKLSKPIIREFGQLIPEVDLAFTAYRLRNQGDGNPAKVNRILPLYHIDGTIRFDKEVAWFKKSYVQTLEPRVYYVYVPYDDQTNIPTFDTDINPLNFEQLFRPNRFSGHDRLGDDNRVAFGLVSRLLTKDSAEEKFRVGLGGGYIFSNHQVCVDDTCLSDANTTEHWSPIGLNMSYQVDSRWGSRLNMAWQPGRDYLDNSSIDFHFSKDNEHRINLNYTYLSPSGANGAGAESVQGGVIWGLNKRWTVLANTSFDLQASFAENYAYGLAYESCSWAMRLLTSRELIASGGVSNVREFDKTIHLQFALKGLGGVGNSSPSHLLETASPGYNDPFSYNNLNFEPSSGF